MYLKISPLYCGTDRPQNGDPNTAIQIFVGIADNAKLCFNAGIIYLQLNQLNEVWLSKQALECVFLCGRVCSPTACAPLCPVAVQAIDMFTQSVDYDPYLAVSFFHRGLCYYFLGDFNSACSDYSAAIDRLRANTFIDYTQLRLEYKMYRAEVLFNRALALDQLGQVRCSKVVLGFEGACVRFGLFP